MRQVEPLNDPMPERSPGAFSVPDDSDLLRGAFVFIALGLVRSFLGSHKPRNCHWCPAICRSVDASSAFRGLWYGGDPATYYGVPPMGFEALCPFHGPAKSSRGIRRY